MERSILFLSGADPTRAYSCIQYLYDSLAKKRYDITLWACIPASERKDTNNWENNSKVKSFYYSSFGKIPRLRLYFRHIKALALCIKYRNQVIISHETTFFKECVFVKKLWPKTKIIHYCTELYDEKSPKHLVKQLDFYKKNTTSLDLLIECNKERLNYRIKNYNIKCKSNYILNTIPKNHYCSSQKHTNKIPIIVYSGGAFIHRDLKKIIDAIALIHEEIKFHLCVYGDSAAIKKLNDYCKEKLPKNCSFIITVNQPRYEILNIIKNSDIGIVYYDPSADIGCKYAAPTKFFEYVSLMIPVISSNNEPLVNLIDQFKIGYYVNNSSIEELYEKIDFLVKNPKIREDIMNNERIVFPEKLCYEIQSRSAIKDIDNLVNL